MASAMITTQTAEDSKTVQGYTISWSSYLDLQAPEITLQLMLAEGHSCEQGDGGAYLSYLDGEGRTQSTRKTFKEMLAQSTDKYEEMLVESCEREPDGWIGIPMGVDIDVGYTGYYDLRSYDILGQNGFIPVGGSRLREPKFEDFQADLRQRSVDLQQQSLIAEALSIWPAMIERAADT